jgi:transcriptional regulator with XRE-family HTH domain
MAMKKIDLGPTGEIVARQVRAYREERKFSYAELSRRLERLNRKIPPLGLRHIEAGKRRVDVDDLTALCQALAVQVTALLIPPYPVPAQFDGASDATKAIFKIGSKDNDGNH